MHLPIADASVDGVVISFGLRNVADPDAALREFARVTRPGGTLVVCEFSRPTWRPFRTVYTEYLMRALPQIARTVSSNPDAYVYLAESIRAWPGQAELAGRLQAAGWGDVGWRDLTGGVVALHRGRRV
jgi:demethylmenaquinone methyltransferase/2-methoxy-6-polyprenyl-1,4-benzoquinol methylase